MHSETDQPDERQAVLARKLHALLEDFSMLEELEQADLEPVSTEWLVRDFLARS